MRIVLATCGSRGDVQPMLALSLALKAAGHDVLLAGPPEKSGWAEQLGCPFRPVGRDVTAFIDDTKNAHSPSAALRFVAFVRREMTDQFHFLPEVVAGADLVVGSSLVFALATVAESMEIPYRYVAFTPQLLPSADHPSFVFRHQGCPRWYNRATWTLVRVLDKLNLTRIINENRRQLGLGPLRDIWLHVLGHRVVVASDPVIAPVPPDVTPGWTQTGYMHLDQPHQTHPELDAFLETGPPPLYAGFGSMPKQDQARIVSIIVEAARAAGQRVIIAKFWDEPSPFSHADDVFFIQKYPHLRLFPRTAAVIHHGGAGTTASAALSGVPQIIVPHVLDQYYWGHQVHRSGLGPTPVWRSRLKAKRLAQAIRACLSDDRIRQNAKGAAEEITRRNSVQRAVDEILGGSGWRGSPIGREIGTL